MVVALIGNPNVGKSTLFNSLTGMKQHTGNWPGKTVEIAQGRYEYKGKEYILVDLPGTYSLDCHSEEERVAVEFIQSGLADCVIIVGDATCLERNLYMALQVMKLSDKLIFCLNLLDEASRKGIDIDVSKLEHQLGIPVTGTTAVTGHGLEHLREKVRVMTDGFLSCKPIKVDPSLIGKTSEQIASSVVSGQKSYSEPADRIVLGKWTGHAIIVALLLLIFMLTISGANYFSSLLERFFGVIGSYLTMLLHIAPDWIESLFMDGVYWTVTCVISVMLPPMLIFYPLFSFLEDLGYLPRAAFLMDHCYSKCGGCGKQALTTAMGFGCNTVGVMGCRIISSPKERLIAILTNSFVPCNGRFPTLILLITVFLTDNSLAAALILLGFVLFGVFVSMAVSGALSRILKKEESYFILELPPYRWPRIKYILVRALRERTISILGRAVSVSAPTGVVIWLLNHVTISGQQLLVRFADILDPVGLAIGMNGAIILAFILSFPANELLMPLLITILQSMSSAAISENMEHMMQYFGITWKTAVCMIVFTIFHWPCGTTCLTIRKETGSWKWTLVAIALPTAVGILVCMLLSIFINI